MEGMARPYLLLPGAPMTSLFQADRQGIQRLDHAGPLPTMVSVGSGTNIADRTGTLRVWATATHDLSHGVWAEVERRDDTSASAIPFLIDSWNLAVLQSFNVDDGLTSQFEVRLPGFPTARNNVFQDRIYRILSLRFGYTVDGVDTVLGSYDSLGVGSAQFALELAVDQPPVMFSADGEVAASVVFGAGDEPLTVLSFAVPHRAALRGDEDDDRRTNALQWTHTPESVLTELNIPGGQEVTRPLSTAGCLLTTVLGGGVSATIPRVLDYSLEQSLNHQLISMDRGEFGEPVPGTFATFGGGFSSTPQADRPDITHRVSVSLKDGPWWHDRALVSPGTSAAIIGSRHRLTVTLPNWEQGLPSPSSPFIASGSYVIQIPNNISLVLRSLQGRTFVLDPHIDGRDLLQNSYATAELLDAIDTTNPGPYDPSVTFADYTIFPFAELFVRTFPKVNVEFKNWKGTGNPWASRDEALDAGMPADDYEYADTLTVGEYRRATSNGARIEIRVLMSYRLNLTRVAVASPPDAVGQLTAHREFSAVLLFDLTDAQCVDLANGATVAAVEVGTGRTASVALEVV